MTLRFDRLLYRKERSFLERALLSPLWVLSLGYGAAVGLRVFLYRAGLFRTEKLSCPVISVGNLTAGGTGKTPVVMALAEGLKRRGIATAVLSRGYGGTRLGGACVSDGRKVLLGPGEAGDEPFLMASRLPGVPVYVGRDRVASGRRALKETGVRGLVLDDGYQHLRLHRDLNVLLVDGRAGFGDSHLLPRGILREPLSQLRRADLYVVTKADEAGAGASSEVLLRRLRPEVPIFHCAYEALSLVGPGGETEPVEALRGKEGIALSGIADPGSFSSLLKRCGMDVAEEITYPDHHSYTEEEVRTLADKYRGAWVVTTEKDMVKLLNLQTGLLSIRALRIGVKIREEEAFFEKVVAVFEGRRENTP
jgi:tetraacyldisaccharide 4'-kinase